MKRGRSAKRVPQVRKLKDSKDKRSKLSKLIEKMVIEDDSYMSVYGKRLTYFVKIPFNRDHWTLNFSYLMMSLLLEENTNIIMADDNNTPASSEWLRLYLKLSSMTHFHYIKRKLMDIGILAKVSVNEGELYVMNPFFVFCGNTIPMYLVKLFEDKNDNIVGYPLWNKLYREVMDIRNLRKELLNNAKKKRPESIIIKAKNQT